MLWLTAGGFVVCGAVGVAVVFVGVGVAVVFVGVGVGVVRVGDADEVVGEALDEVVVGVGVGALFAVAAQTAPPTSPRSAARAIPPMTQPVIDFFGSSP
ncbi:MAG TPA: hypothetical protein DCQ04_14850 [Actinobacteria bacterium]|nr:hypothetical protein [Actinomycetota bacterium]